MTEKKKAETIGTRIAAARAAKGLTQSQFAEKAGIKQAMVSRYEAGKEVPSLEIIMALKIVAETPLINLILGPNGVSEVEAMSKMKPDKIRVRIAKLIRGA
jgi:transcriptional regulator with XRE-family HTH domain